MGSTPASMDDYLVLAGAMIIGMGGIAALLYKLSASSSPVKVVDSSSNSATSAKNARKSAAKKAKKKAAKTAEHKPEPELISEPEAELEPVPEPVPDPEMKKKKKKKAKVPEPATEPEPAPEPEPVPEPEPEPEPESKKKKKKKMKGEAAVPAAPAPGPIPVVTKEEEWEDVVSSKTRKKGEKRLVDAPAPTTDVQAVAPTSKASKPAKKPPSNPAPDAPTTPPALNPAPAPMEDEWTTVPRRGSKRDLKNILAEEPGYAVVDEDLSVLENGQEYAEVSMELGETLGTVIGKGGASIRQITVESGARLDIEKGSSICKISGAPEAVKKASDMVHTVMNKRAEEMANHRTVVIPVGSKAPAVLGKGGTVIRRITVESGARMDVSCDDGTVTISGTEAQIAAAQELVKLTLHGEAQEQIELGTRGVYVIKGAGGSTIRRMQEETGARFDIDAASKTLTVSGDKTAVSKAAALVRETLVSNSCELEVGVNDTDIGAVVGKGGCNIKAIQTQSGANVEIQRGVSGMMSVVKLVGTSEQVEAAKLLVEKCVAREPELGPGEVCETLELGGAVGMVIGSSGASVKQLQEETGAKVDIMRGCGTCKVFGSVEAVEAAKAKIQEKLDAHAEREAKLTAAAAATAASHQSDLNGGWEPAAPPVGVTGEPWETATTAVGGWEPAEAPVASTGGPPPMSSWGGGADAGAAAWSSTCAPPGFSDWKGNSNPEPW